MSIFKRGRVYGTSSCGTGRWFENQPVNPTKTQPDRWKWLNFMVAIVLIHMVQVFLFGAYKFPRELTWIVGVLLLLVTLGMAFTGQVLRFDQDAYWGLGIGASIASRVPVIGPWVVNLMLGGPIIAGATLSRFFALHVLPDS